VPAGVFGVFPTGTSVTVWYSIVIKNGSGDTQTITVGWTQLSAKVNDRPTGG
jgi:hypothetical protein